AGRPCKRDTRDRSPSRLVGSVSHEARTANLWAGATYLRRPGRTAFRAQKVPKEEDLVKLRSLTPAALPTAAALALAFLSPALCAECPEPNAVPAPVHGLNPTD